MQAVNKKTNEKMTSDDISVKRRKARCGAIDGGCQVKRPWKEVTLKLAPKRQNVKKSVTEGSGTKGT